jgi:hypothetical protein
MQQTSERILDAEKPEAEAPKSAAGPRSKAATVKDVPEVKSDLRPFLVVLLVSIVAVVAMNLSVDAGGLGNQEEMAVLVKQQGPGDLIVAEELGWQRAWVKTRLLDGTCPDVLFLGSSTSGGLSQEMFPGTKILNGWMGGPTIEDFEAMTNVLRRAPCVPKTIVVGADPWWVGNGEVDDQRWQAVTDEFLGYQKDRSSVQYAFFWSRIEWNRLKERLNFTTTKESATLLLQRARHGDAKKTATVQIVHMTEDEACAKVDELGFKHVRSFDGHYTQCPKFRASPEELERVATHWLSDNMHRMAEWNSVDTARFARLERVVDAWRSLGARVVISGNPYHPETWKRLQADPGVSLQLLRLDAMLDDLARSRRTVFVNMRDPAKHGCAPDEFEDADHGNPTCVRKMAAKLRAEAHL